MDLGSHFERKRIHIRCRGKDRTLMFVLRKKVGKAGGHFIGLQAGECQGWSRVVSGGLKNLSMGKRQLVRVLGKGTGRLE